MLVKQSDGTMAELQPRYTAAPAPAQNAGVVNINARGVIYDIFTVPPELNVSISSDAEALSVTKTVYAFNVSVLNAAVTDNGSGANSIVTTYGDGFSGRAYDSLIKSANGGRGVAIKGFTLSVTNYTSGAQTATPINTMALQLLCANSQGGTTPVPINVNAALRNTQYQIGVYTVATDFVLNGLNQLSMSLPANTIFTFTFITESGTL